MDEVGGQKGRRTLAVRESRTEPPRPATRPVSVTPPFVPRGTLGKGGRIRRGALLARIPSSLDSVSEAVAA